MLDPCGAFQAPCLIIFYQAWWMKLTHRKVAKVAAMNADFFSESASIFSPRFSARTLHLCASFPEPKRENGMVKPSRFNELIELIELIRRLQIVRTFESVRK